MVDTTTVTSEECNVRVVATSGASTKAAIVGAEAVIVMKAAARVISAAKAATVWRIQKLLLRLPYRPILWKTRRLVFTMVNARWLLLQSLHLQRLQRVLQ